MTLHLVAKAAKDGAGSTITGGVQFNDESGAGTGPLDLTHLLIDSTQNEILGTTADAAVATDANGSVNAHIRGVVKILAAAVAAAAGALFSKITDGTNTAAVKAASTVPLVTDPALVVAISPNGQNTNGRKDPGLAAPVIASLATDMTSSRVNAAASTNATSLKASAGSILNIAVFNVAAYDVFVKFYNKASAPTVGTDTPVWTMPLKAGTGFFGPFPSGTFFATGIAYAITKLQADSDTTVLVAGDVTGKIDWV